jgi:hypothetical protein
MNWRTLRNGASVSSRRRVRRVYCARVGAAEGRSGAGDGGGLAESSADAFRLVVGFSVEPAQLRTIRGDRPTFDVLRFASSAQGCAKATSIARPAENAALHTSSGNLEIPLSRLMLWRPCACSIVKTGLPSPFTTKHDEVEKQGTNVLRCMIFIRFWDCILWMRGLCQFVMDRWRPFLARHKNRCGLPDMPHGCGHVQFQKLWAPSIIERATRRTLMVWCSVTVAWW